MQFTVFREKARGVFWRSRLKNRIKIVVDRSQVKQVHDLLTEGYPKLIGGRHYAYDACSNVITFECDVAGNHDVIGRILNDLIPWDKESVF